jgi:formiminotetrahydrofolate cyclodeaminase
MKDDFAERLASAAPTPGGGAAAARTGRHAAALLRMSLAITLGKDKKSAGPEAASRKAALEEASRRAAELQARFEDLETQDMRAFERYLETLRLPRGTPEEKSRRKEERSRAAEGAALVPLETMDVATVTLELAGELLDPSNGASLQAESDIGCAIELAWAAIGAAEMNVLVNLPETGPGVRDGIELRWREIRARGDRAYERAKLQIRQRLPLPGKR